MAAFISKIITPLNDHYPKLYLRTKCPYSRTRGPSGGPTKPGLCPKIGLKKALDNFKKRQQDKQVWPVQVGCPRAQFCSSVTEKTCMTYPAPSLAQITSSRTKYRPNLKFKFLWFWLSCVQLTYPVYSLTNFGIQVTHLRLWSSLHLWRVVCYRQQLAPECNASCFFHSGHGYHGDYLMLPCRNQL